jgi:hypothetical protein
MRSMADDIINNNLVLSPETICMLQSLFPGAGGKANEPAMDADLPKTASVKFMITLEDEKNLGELGYSQAQIGKMKPNDAAEILQAGARAVAES